MADDYKHLIQDMFKSIPDDQKALFLSEVLASLSESDREVVLSQFRDGTPSTPATAPQPTDGDHVSSPVQETVDPDKEMERLIRLQEFSFEQDRSSMKSQMTGCLVWAFAALAGVVAVGYALGKAWQWLNGLAG